MPLLYQHLLTGVVSYERLGSRVLRQIKSTHAFRQVSVVRELASILLNLPLREYRLIGQYYLVWCKCRDLQLHAGILESIAEQSATYTAKALISRGSFDAYESKFESALHFYAEARKASDSISDYIAASRGIALAKSSEGFHPSALKELEQLIPLLKYAEPLTYFDVINSYAVELNANNRVSEARTASIVAVSSPFSPFYPEWQETFSEVDSKRKRSSIVTVPLSQEYEAPEPEPNALLCDPRVQVAIDFMNGNLQRKVTLSESARVAYLSPSRFSHLFKTQTGLSPGEYLIRLRMEKARHLLTTSLLSIKEVMALVGYGTRSNFVLHFKRFFDCAPSEYKKRRLERRRQW